MNNEQIPSNLYDLDIERSILSSIFFNEDAFSEVFGIIDDKDFYLKAHADIFKAMMSCYSHDEPIDIGFVKKRLENNYNEEILSEILSLSALVDVEKYARELKDKSIRRNLLKIAVNVPKMVNEATPSKDLIDSVAQKIYELTDGVGSNRIKQMPEVIKTLVEKIAHQKDLENKDIVGLDTGFRYLNHYTKGFKDGEFIIIAARPAMGKTTFAISLISKIIQKGEAVVLFSLEMSSDDVAAKILSANTSIPLSNLMTASMSDEEYDRLSAACQELSEQKLFIYDSGYVNIHQVRTQLRKLKADHNEIKLCVIDYLGLMTSSGNFSERHLQIAEISRNLKLLAMELKIPIIALAQLNRNLDSRSNKRPMLSDLRESGAIEQDADIIMFVYRDEVYAEQAQKEREARAAELGKEIAITPARPLKNENEEEAEIIIAKNRRGEIGTVKLIFQKHFARFVDASFNTGGEMENFNSDTADFAQPEVSEFKE